MTCSKDGLKWDSALLFPHLMLSSLDIQPHKEIEKEILRLPAQPVYVKATKASLP